MDQSTGFHSSTRTGIGRKSRDGFGEIFREFKLKRVLKGLLDRPQLKLKPQFRKGETTIESGSIDGVNLEKLRKICNGNLIVSKMVRYLMDQNEPINFQQFKEGIEYEQSNKQFKSHLDNGSGKGSQYGKLLDIKNNYQEIIMNPNIRQYISNNNL